MYFIFFKTTIGFLRLFTTCSTMIEKGKRIDFSQTWSSIWKPSWQFDYTETWYMHK